MKKILLTIIWLLAILMPSATWAQSSEAYAVLSEENTVLTFYYDDQKDSRTGTKMTVTTGETRGWYSYMANITSVTFDNSFANYTGLTSTGSWFNGCTSLTSITGLGNLNTDNVTNMSVMFRMCTSLTSIDFDNFKTASATDLNNMFFGCSGLTSLDLSGFETANVVDMHSMFAGCTSLTTLDLSSFNTPSLTNMNGMFSGCDLLEAVDLSNFNTSLVTDVSYLFNYCPALTTVYVGNSWDMSAVIDNGNSVFNSCTSIVGGEGTTYSSSHIDYTYAHIDGGTSNPGYFTDIADYGKVKEAYAVLSDENTKLTFYYDKKKTDRSGMSVGPFVTSLGRAWNDNSSSITTVIFDSTFANNTTLTSTASWFSNFDNLTTITGIENLNTANVTDMSFMFDGCSSLTSLDVSGFNTSSVTDMSCMVRNCSGLTTLDVSGFNTVNVINMNSMFYGCSGLTSLDLSGFNTANLMDMNYMFYDCSGLTSLDVSNFNTANVSSMLYVFWGCAGLTSLDLSSFNTANVMDMRYMFYGCSGLTSLDLSKFNTANVTNMMNMFGGCSSLATIYVGDEWRTTAVAAGAFMFAECSSLVGGEGTVYDADWQDVSYAHIDGGTSNPGYLTDIADYGKVKEAYAALSDENTKLTFYYDKKKESRSGMNLGPFGAENERGWADYKSIITNAVFDPSFANVTNITNTANWFNGMESLTAIEGLQYLNTSNVTKMRYMFYKCSSLASLDLSSFDTQNVTDFNSMFEECTSLTSLDLSNFNTANVTDVNYMFSNCSGLTNLDISNFNTAKLTSMLYMFAGCSSLTSLDLTSFNTEKVADPRELFNHCSSLKTIYVGSGWSNSAVYLSTNMFGSCTSIVGGKGTTYDAEKTGHEYAHFDYGSSNPGYFTPKNGYVEETVFTWSADELTMTSGTDGASIYYTLTNSEGTTTPTQYTSPITVTSDVLIEAYAEKDGMASSMTTALDYPYTAWMELITAIADAQNVLTSADGNDNVPEVKRDSLISQISAAQSSYISRTDPLAVINKLTNDLIAITETVRQLANAVNEPYAALSDNSTSLNITGVDIHYAKTLTFYYDKKKAERNGMDVNFTDNTLRGWNSSASYITEVVFDPSFAECTTLTSTAWLFYNLGILTTITGLENLKTDSVTNMHMMFAYCPKLTSLDVSGFKMDKVIGMHGMFTGCSGLTSLDVSGFNTASATDMGSLFNGCTSLTSLNLSSFNTENVTDMSYMFAYCPGLTALDLSSFNTAKVANMEQMFCDDIALTTIYVDDTKWNTDAVTSSTSMFYRCTNLVGGEGTTYENYHDDVAYAHIDGGPDNPGYLTEKSTLAAGDLFTAQTIEGVTLTYYVINPDQMTCGVANNNEKTYMDTETTGVVTIPAIVRGYSVITISDYAFKDCAGVTEFVLPESLRSIAQCAFRNCTSLTTVHIPANMTTIESLNGHPWVGCNSLTTITVDAANPVFDSRDNCNAIMVTAENTLRIGSKGVTIPESTVTIGHSAFSNMGELPALVIPASVTGITAYAFWGCSYPSVTSYIEEPFETSCVWDHVGDNCILYVPAGKVDTYKALSEWNNFQTITTIGAEKEAYAVLNDDNTTLTFYYDLNKESRSGLDVTPVTSAGLRSWHSESSAITTVVFDSSFANDTTLTSTAWWFYGMSNLTTITGIENLKTDSVTSMIGMFQYCESLTSLDLSGFNTSKVESMEHMFYGCKNLASIDMSNFNTANVTSMASMFYRCQNLLSIDLSGFKTSNVLNMSAMFENCSAVTSLDMSGFNTANVTSTEAMFSGCTGLTVLDISSFNTAQVTEMTRMFGYCTNLKTIYVGSGWSATNGNGMFVDCTNLVGGAGTVYNPAYIDWTYAHIDGGPSNPGYLTDIADLGKVNEAYAVLADNDDDITTDEGTAKGKTLTFYYDKKKQERNGMDVGPFDDWLNVSWYSSVKRITQVSFDDSFAGYTGLTSTAYWFRWCDNLSSILGIDNLKTDNVTDMREMFHACASLTSINVSGFNTANVTNMSGMFSECTKLTSLDISNFNTEKVTDMSTMFAHNSMTSINLGNINTSNVTLMNGMFDGCDGLTSLDLSSFNTGNVTDMSYMFWSCSGLSTLDLSNFDTENVTDMSCMFWDCNELSTLDLSSFNTKNTTSMRAMFYSCNSLKNIDLSGFNTPNLTNTNQMFGYCNNLINLDLSSFKTDYVTDMGSMFSSCSRLETINVGSGWTTAAVTEGSSMFGNCTNLKGGAGTIYDANHTDYTYAHIDGGPSNPGYLTKSLSMGDANGDGEINIADAVATVTNILGEPTEGNFYRYAADMNGDSVIDIFDVTLIVNAVFAATKPAPAMTRGYIDNVPAEAIRLTADASDIYMDVDQAQQYTAFQFDMSLPEGMSLVGVKLASDRTDHQVSFVQRGENEYRVVGLSMSNEALYPADGHLIQLQVSNMAGESNVKVSNVLFVTPAGKTVTGIDELLNTTMATDGNIYNLKGEKLGKSMQQLGKGIYIMNHKKVIIK